jgi:cellulose synthase/poly-beta-1,6-N-acetylglucosamine synthase-like glycosyltransferase
MILLYKRNSSKCDLVPCKLMDFPVVTIQLPVFNEKFVVKRLIDSTLQMDYPKEKLDIQVLDDSTDETLEISRAMVDKYARKGFRISLFHRKQRTGHKGGALREALSKAKGDFVAIFDADFIPARNFLTATIPCLLEDPRIGMVQTRWGHLNTDYSLLTKAQAIGVDGHFIIDQVARAGNNLYMNFNGTAGIWRKQCIIDAGNWQDDTLTEDFDLSYRAELKGWKFKYIKDIVNPAELPVQISAYKSQQFRWCKGSIQTACKLAGRILASKEPLFVKMEALLHMFYYSVHPFMLLCLILIVPLNLMDLKAFNAFLFYALCAVLIVSSLGPFVFYSFSQYVLYPDWKRRIKWVPFMAILGTGSAVNNSRAFLEAILGKRSEFIRTPKLGVEKSRKGSFMKKSYKVSVKNWTTMFFEFAFMSYSFLGILLALKHDTFFTIPFLFICFLSFAYVFFQSLAEEIESRRMVLSPEWKG